MATGAANFLPLFRDYLVAKLQFHRDRVRIDTLPDAEIKLADGKVVALFLGAPQPHNGNTDPGAGRHAYLMDRQIQVRIATSNTGDHGTNRERLLIGHWVFEDKILNAIQQCNYRDFEFIRPPKLLPGSDGYTHMKEVLGGLESALNFQISYKVSFADAGQPGPPV